MACPQGASSATFPWDETSTYIRRPPFAVANSANRLGTYKAHPLLVLGDDMTTDHISPAGQINAESYAGRHLVAAGNSPDDLNVYTARRGNWEAMVRGLFDNRTAANLLLGGRSAADLVQLRNDRLRASQCPRSVASSPIGIRLPTV